MRTLVQLLWSSVAAVGAVTVKGEDIKKTIREATETVEHPKLQNNKRVMPNFLLMKTETILRIERLVTYCCCCDEIIIGLTCN